MRMLQPPEHMGVYSARVKMNHLSIRWAFATFVAHRSFSPAQHTSYRRKDGKICVGFNILSL